MTIHVRGAATQPEGVAGRSGKAGAADKPAGSRPLLDLKIRAARLNVTTKQEQLARYLAGVDPKLHGLTVNEGSLRGKVAEAEDHLRSLHQAYVKLTGQTFSEQPSPLHQNTSDRFGSGSGDPPEAKGFHSKARGPSPEPPRRSGSKPQFRAFSGSARASEPSSRPAFVSSSARASVGSADSRTKRSLPKALAAVLSSSTYASRESSVRELDLKGLLAVESDLGGHLRRDPELRDLMRRKLGSPRAFNQALAAVHPDKNRPQVEKSETLFDQNPARHQANVSDFLSKLDAARNILNKCRELKEDPKFSDVFPP